MTVSEPGHPATDDPLASQRLELLGKLVAAQMSLEKAMAELASSGADTSAASAQLSILAGLQASIGTASATALAAMKGEIASVVAQSKTLAEQARTDAQAASAASILADTVNASRNAVSSAMESLRHIPLTFSSPEDERAYRSREDERARYMAEQNAKGTPTGNLNAAGAAVGQMVDAKAHGAQGPEFDKQWANLVGTTEKLREQVRASGGSTKEFDDRLRNDLRQIMKSKGLTDAEIDARFAANPDPLEAAKAYVANADVQAITAKVANSPALETTQADSVQSYTPSAPPSPMDDALATLKSAGVSVPPDQSSASPNHGLNIKLVVAATNARQA